jgi:hypothetical protein
MANFDFWSYPTDTSFADTSATIDRLARRQQLKYGENLDSSIEMGTYLILTIDCLSLFMFEFCLFCLCPFPFLYLHVIFVAQKILQVKIAKAIEIWT